MVDPEYYEPGDSRTFGNPPRPLTNEDVDAWVQAFSGLSPTQVEDRIHRAVQLFQRDRFRSALPTLKEGTAFVRHVLPLMLREYGVTELMVGLKEPVVVYDRILTGLWEGDKKAVAGGLETNYIFMNRPSETQAYEYLGEAIGRLVRAALVPKGDLSLKTQALFGWVGRLVMKKVYPATDFSFDRHEARVAKEKEELAAHFEELAQKVSEGVKEPLAPEKCYQFFDEHTYGQISSVSMAETPLQYRLAADIFNYGGDLPTHASSSNDFPRFVEDWQRVVVAARHEKRALPWEIWGAAAYRTYLVKLDQQIKEGGFLYQETQQYFRGLFRAYGCSRVSQLPQEVIEDWYRTETRKEELVGARVTLGGWQRHGEIFGDLLASPEALAGASREQLLKIWFTLHQKGFLRKLAAAQKEIETFQTSYFRFIKDKPTAEGYAFAQQHIAEVLADLPAVVRLPEAEVRKRFMSGRAPVLNEEGDYGCNRAEDYSDDELRSRRELFIDDSQEPQTDEDRVWMWEIRNGENTRIWEELMSLAMTEERKILGAVPLFFGFEYSDRLAAVYTSGKTEEFAREEASKSRYERSIGRIKELAEGKFKLPHTWVEVLRNADLQLARITDPRRIKAINEIKDLVQEAARRGIIHK